MGCFSNLKNIIFKAYITVFYIKKFNIFMNFIFVKKIKKSIKKDLGHQNTMLNSAFASLPLNACGLRNTQNTFPRY